MKRSSKKMLSMFLAFVMTISVVPMNVFANEDNYIDSDTITAFAELKDEVATQVVAMGSDLDADLPKDIEATVETKKWTQVASPASATPSMSSVLTTSTIDIPVDWVLSGNTAFSTDSEAMFTYTAQVPASYSVASGVALPTITVEVKSAVPMPTSSHAYATWADFAATAVEGTDYEVDGVDVDIHTMAGFAWFAQETLAGDDFAGKTVVLRGTIDFVDADVAQPWESMGEFAGEINSSSSTPILGFNGENPLFSTLTADGEILQVYVEYVDVSSSNGTAILVEENNGTIRNVAVTGSISVDADFLDKPVGAIASVNNGEIYNCAVSVNITVNGNGAIVGGIVGENTGTVQNSYNLGYITVDGSNIVGGIVGENTGTVEIVYYAGEITAPNAQNLGGVVGTNSGTVEDTCYYMEQNSVSVGVGNDNASSSMSKTREYMKSADFKDLLDDARDAAKNTDLDPWYQYGNAFPKFQAISLNTTWEDIAMQAVLGTDYDIDGNDIEIHTAEGLAWFANYVNTGNSAEDMLVTLTDDISLWKIITNYYNFSYITKYNSWVPIDGFSGTFDGAGHSIRYVSINDSTSTQAKGLFGTTEDGAVIKNLQLSAVNIVGGGEAGALVGKANGSLELYNITLQKYSHSVTNMINAGSYAGGIVGAVEDATIANCSVTDLAFEGTPTYAGGIVGYADGNTNIQNCYGWIPDQNAGGILGYAGVGVEAENCYFDDSFNKGVSESNDDRVFDGIHDLSYVYSVIEAEWKALVASLNDWVYKNDAGMAGVDLNYWVWDDPHPVFATDETFVFVMLDDVIVEASVYTESTSVTVSLDDYDEVEIREFVYWTSEDIVIPEADKNDRTITFDMPAHNVVVKAVYENPEITGSVSISGSAIFGNELTANLSNVNAADVAIYQWKRGDENIGTNSNKYTLTEADIGKTITVEVSSNSTSGTITSQPTEKVEKADGFVIDSYRVKNPSTGENNDALFEVFWSTELVLIPIIEYADNPEFTNSQTMSGTIVTGLSDKTYYFRAMESSTHKPGTTIGFTFKTFVAIEDVELKNSKVDVGQALKLDYIITPEGVNYGHITWRVVDENGTGASIYETSYPDGYSYFTATAPGTAKIELAIHAYTPDVVKYYFDITVNEGARTEQTISFASGTVDKTVGDANFTNAVSGAYTTVTYTSGNTRVATVNSTTGEVSIVGAGTAIITATAEETWIYEGATASYVLSVDNGTVSTTQDETTIFDGEFDDLDDVILNGEKLSVRSNGALYGYPDYTANNGIIGVVFESSIGVTLYKEFIAFLPTGSYELNVTTHSGLSTETTITVPEKTTHSVTVANLGTGTNGTFTKQVGDIVEIYAGTREGFRFDSWTIEGATLDSTSANRTMFVMMSSDVAITANWLEGEEITTDSSEEDSSSEYNFWQDVVEEIENSKNGDTIKVDAKSYDKMTLAVMDALRNHNVNLVIDWYAGDTILIPAGMAKAQEAYRVYWPLSKLAELYAGNTLPDSVINSLINPNTGGTMEGGSYDSTVEAPTVIETQPVYTTNDSGETEMEIPQVVITAPTAGYEIDMQSIIALVTIGIALVVGGAAYVVLRRKRAE